jgi:hypothetical protein
MRPSFSHASVAKSPAFGSAEQLLDFLLQQRFVKIDVDWKLRV